MIIFKKTKTSWLDLYLIFLLKISKANKTFQFFIWQQLFLSNTQMDIGLKEGTLISTLEKHQQI